MIRRMVYRIVVRLACRAIEVSVGEVVRRAKRGEPLNPEKYSLLGLLGEVTFIAGNIRLLYEGKDDFSDSMLNEIDHSARNLHFPLEGLLCRGAFDNVPILRRKEV